MWDKKARYGLLETRIPEVCRNHDPKQGQRSLESQKFSRPVQDQGGVSGTALNEALKPK